MLPSYYTYPIQWSQYPVRSARILTSLSILHFLHFYHRWTALGWSVGSISSSGILYIEASLFAFPLLPCSFRFSCSSFRFFGLPFHFVVVYLFTGFLGSHIHPARLSLAYFSSSSSLARPFFLNTSTRSPIPFLHHLFLHIPSYIHACIWSNNMSPPLPYRPYPCRAR